MRAIFLAAGYATRLYPLTKNMPKALLPIGKQPLLNYLVDKLKQIGDLSGVDIVTNDLFTGQFETWSKTLGLRVPVRVFNDGTTSNDNRLGAIGDLQFAIKKGNINEDILVLASDNLFEGSLADFSAAARKKNAVSIGVYDIGDPKIAAGRYGIIECDKDFRIKNIEEKPAAPKTTIVSMGVYYFPKQTLPLIDDYMKSSEKQDAPGHYATWLLQKTPVYAFLFSGKWYDIGSLDQLEEARRAYSK